jgi:CRP-like cAMP-binding protein
MVDVDMASPSLSLIRTVHSNLQKRIEDASLAQLKKPSSSIFLPLSRSNLSYLSLKNDENDEEKQFRVAAAINYGYDSGDADDDIITRKHCHLRAATAGAACHDPPAAIILHCNLLSGLDASAIDFIDQISSVCKEHDCKLAFAALESSNRVLLEKTNIFNQPHVMLFRRGLNEALSALEDEVLSTAFKVNGRLFGESSSSQSLESLTTLDGFERCLHIIQDRLSIPLDMQALRGLSGYCTMYSFKCGDKIRVARNVQSPLVKGKGASSSRNAKGLFFLNSGYILCEYQSHKDGKAAAAAAGAAGASAGKRARRVGADRKGFKPSLELTEFDKLELHHSASYVLQNATQHGPGWVFGRMKDHKSTLASTDGSKTAVLGKFKREDYSWDEHNDVLLEGRHYTAETDATLYFLPMEAIEEARETKPASVIALYELLAALLKEQLLRSKVQLSRLNDVMCFHDD